MHENIIVGLDLISAIAFGVALLFAVRIPRSIMDQPSKTFLALCMGIYVFVGCSNMLEHGQITDCLDHYEDYVEIFFPLFFLFFIYSVITRQELNNRKLAEKAARHALKDWEDIFQASGNPTFILDGEHGVISANRATVGATGKSKEALLGMKCYEIMHGTDQPPEGCPMEKMLISGHCETVEMEVEVLGSVFLVSCTPMLDDEGNLQKVIHIATDITENKQAEEEKKILEDQLRQAQKLEAVGQLAGGIAHDFNNILTAIIGYSNMLQMKMAEDDPLLTDVNQILTSSHKAAQLTQSLLAFSRQQIIHPKPVSLNEIIVSVEKLLLRLIGEDIELKANLTDMDLTIMADSGQIEQVMMNLATNARDAMPEGGMLTISTELVELDKHFIKTHAYDVKPGMYSLICFTDTGEGMDENTRKRIFEPFFTTKELGRGTGLGLAIIYGIVKQHNGFVDVYSKPGKGTTFKIYLPIIKSAITETKAEILSPPKGGTETVLVAEDNEVVRTIIKAILDRFGYKVIEAVDGDDAVIRFKENKDKIDLVILDVVMPKKNGKMAYDDIKKLWPEIKAIFTSGYTKDFVDKKGILEEGINFIPKPISANELLRKIRKVLDK